MQEILALPKSETSQSQPVDSSAIWPAVNRVKCGTLSSAEFFDPTRSCCKEDLMVASVTYRRAFQNADSISRIGVKRNATDGATWFLKFPRLDVRRS